MPFVKGNKITRKGVKNNPDINSLRNLLEESFSENRPWIKECISNMLQDYRVHLTEINKRIAAVLPTEKEYTADLKFLCNTRTALLEEFKFLLMLKERMEPKQVNAKLDANFKFEHLLELAKTAETDFNRTHANHN